MATTPARTRPPTAKSQKAAPKKALNKSTPKSSAAGQKQKGLQGARRAPKVPMASSLGGPPRLPPPGTLPPSSSFSVNAPPLTAPSAPLGVGHMSNYPQPLGRGGVGAGAQGDVGAQMRQFQTPGGGLPAQAQPPQAPQAPRAWGRGGTPPAYGARRTANASGFSPNPQPQMQNRMAQSTPGGMSETQRRHGGPGQDVPGAGQDNWIAGATKNKGGLHRSLGVPPGKTIPAKKVNAAAQKGGKVGKQARLAQTLKGLKK